MRYWWVNQNQTYRTEVRGNFMWSPKTNARGARNPFYAGTNVGQFNREQQAFLDYHRANVFKGVLSP